MYRLSMTGIAIASVIVVASPLQSGVGHYLAGLIEGDGSIKIPDNRVSSSGRWRYPTITIAFALKDLPLAQLLASIFLGKISRGTKDNPGNYYVLTINRLASLYVIATLLNGNMRRPKIEALHRLIAWFNAYSAESGSKQKFPPLTALGLDTSPFNTNRWLAGFLDADSNFLITFQLNADLLATQVQLYMRISQRQVYGHRVSALPTSYIPFMEGLANFLSASFSLFTRERVNRKGLSCTS